MKNVAKLLVGIALLSSFVSVGCVSANTISSPPVEVLARRIIVSDFRRDYVKSYTKMIRNTRGHMVPVTFSNGVKVGVQYMYFGYMYDEDYGVTNIVVDK